MRCLDVHNDVMFFRPTPAGFGCIWGLTASERAAAQDETAALAKAIAAGVAAKPSPPVRTAAVADAPELMQRMKTTRMTHGRLKGTGPAIWHG